MGYVPDYIVLDYETALLDGTPTVDLYRQDARAISAAFAWRGKNADIRTEYHENEQDIHRFLLKCKKAHIPIVVHNYQFEYLATYCRFKGLEDLITYDTMRMTQVYDNGGRFQKEYQPDSMSIDDQLKYLDGEYAPREGLGLEASASRILPKELCNHKKRFKDLIKERGGKGFKDMHLLSHEENKEYNLSDSIVTLHLYETLLKKLKDLNIEWLNDHELYKSTSRYTAMSKINGVHVDKSRLSGHIKKKSLELEDTKVKFKEYFKDEIAELEREFTEKKLAGYKSDRGREKAKLGLIKNPIEFNPNSTTQLAKLFVDKLGMKWKYSTKKGSPSFAGKFLAQWGEGGLLLRGQKRALLELKQGQSLDKASDQDGKWHIDIKVAGAATNRLAGGSHNLGPGMARLNIQGLSRRCESLMSCIVAPPGRKFVSIDLSAGEPTCLSHYSRDPMYRLANFEMVGKKPYFDNIGTLIIDDMYLMTASRFPAWQEEIKDVFHSKFKGMTFADYWLEDSEYLAKKVLGGPRGIAKPLCLAEGTLVRVKGYGWKEIQEVTANDQIWDGEQWVLSEGAVHKGNRECINLLGVYMTPDHKILTKQGWSQANDFTKKERRERKISRKGLERLQEASGSWPEVWGLGGSIIKSAFFCFKEAANLGKMRTWKFLERLLQFKVW